MSSPNTDTEFVNASTNVCLSIIADLPTLTVILVSFAPITSIGVPAAGSEALGYPVRDALLSLSHVNTKPPVLRSTFLPTPNP